MAGETASFSVVLEDETSGAANAAAASLSRLKSEIDEDMGALRGMQAAMRSLQSATTPNAAAIKNLATQMSALKAKIGANQAEFVNLGGSFKKVAAEANKASAAVKSKGANLEEMTALAKGALGPMGGIYEKATLITKGIGSGGIAGAAIAAAAAFVVLTSAIVAGYFALAKYAVTVNKGAMERLGKVSKKAEENVAKLFSKVRVEAFVKVVEEVAEMLDESSASAQAVKEILATMLNPLFDAVGGAGPLIKRFFQGMVIGALLVTIAVLKVRNALKDVLPDELAGKVDILKVALYAGIAVTFSLVGALVALAAVGAVVAVVAFVAMATMAAMFAGALIIVGACLALLLAPFIMVGLAVYAAIAYFDEIKAAILDFTGAAWDAAGALIDGLVNGIVSGTGAVMSAIRNLASNMTGALKAALGIASPSKVFAELGVNASLGMAEGVEDGSGAVESAVGSMVSLPAAQSPARGGGVGGSTYTITVNVDAAGKDGPGIAASIRSQIEDLLEQLATESGAPEAA